MSKLEIALLVGAESKSWLERLEKALAKLETLNGPVVSDDDDEEDIKPTKGKKPKAFDDDDEEEAPEETESENDEDEEDKPVKGKGKKPKAFDDDDEEEEDIKPAKKGKAKKLTIDDCNDACKERAAAGGKKGRKEVLALLKENFGTESVSEIEESDYAELIRVMKEE